MARTRRTIAEAGRRRARALVVAWLAASSPVAAAPQGEVGAGPGPTPHVLERVVVLGASVSMGFGLSTTAAQVLEATLARAHEPLAYQWSGFFFLRPIETATEQVAFAARHEPTLVLGVDFLFWMGYGTSDAEGRPLRADRDRLELLERGLALLDTLSCPLVVGDFPDMTDAVGRMLAPEQVPRPATRALLNRRVAEWARARGDVVVVPLDRILAEMRAGEPFTIGRYRWPAGSVDRVLQEDRLHPTLEGQAALLHHVAVELVERGWTAAADWDLDLGAVVARCDPEASDPAARPLEASQGVVR